MYSIIHFDIGLRERDFFESFVWDKDPKTTGKKGKTG